MKTRSLERSLTMTDRRIGVLVVDDSKVGQMLLVHILESDAEMCVVGAVSNGQAALDFVTAHAPDVILMDLHMPGMDGFEATRRIMETHPVPIIVCTATADPEDVATTFRVMEVGALAFVAKPVGREHAEFEQIAAHLRQTVKLMSEVKVVQRSARARLASAPSPVARPVELHRAAAGIRFIGIGASTGGPQVLHEILTGLPRAFPVPILIVQHIAHGFLSGLAEWLKETSGFQIHIGADGVGPLPGHMYLAPDDFHMGISASGRILLSKGEPENGLRPAVSHLFRSLADAIGPAAVGVLLTGMGKDGATELRLMKDNGAVTIAQDCESSVVNGMPGEAIKLGGATYVLPAGRIADRLVALVNSRTSQEVEL
jgi:two-component system chemotaxis response regulator CheB